ncbi:MAG: phage holin family protein [Bacteroidetes bacterium]|jgi:hypothetical protein|nr:phage holin family protein [Bacteroidota bacterium]
MNAAFDEAEKLAATIRDYISTRFDIIKLQAADKVSGLLANVMAVVIVGFVFSLGLIFCGMALARWIGAWLGQLWLGYFIVGMLYFLFGVIVWFARKKLIYNPILNALIKQLMKGNDEKN